MRARLAGEDEPGLQKPPMGPACVRRVPVDLHMEAGERLPAASGLQSETTKGDWKAPHRRFPCTGVTALLEDARDLCGDGGASANAAGPAHTAHAGTPEGVGALGMARAGGNCLDGAGGHAGDCPEAG